MPGWVEQVLLQTSTGTHVTLKFLEYLVILLPLIICLCLCLNAFCFLKNKAQMNVQKGILLTYTLESRQWPQNGACTMI